MKLVAGPSPEPVDWATLVRQTIEGDEDARIVLAAAAADRLGRWCGGYRLSEQDCEDTRQQVLSVMFAPDFAWLRTWSPTGGRSFPTYMFAKASFLASDLMGSRMSRPRLDLAEIAEVLPVPERELLRPVLVVVREELAKLPDKQRDAIWGRMCGYTSQELAEKHQTTSATVDVWRHRGLRTLKAAIKRRLDDS
ncbi:MAG: sigma-70 family RNA polymerase sigma factor [Candidatus Eisenbacteria bacterium]